MAENYGCLIRNSAKLKNPRISTSLPLQNNKKQLMAIVAGLMLNKKK